MKRRHIVLTLLIGLSGGVAACGNDKSHPIEISVSEIVGTWAGDRGGSIVFRADGRFVADDLDGALIVEVGNVAGEQQGEGTWHVARSAAAGKNYDLQLTFPYGGIATLTAWYSADKIRLIYYVGDPDSRDLYIFDKVGANA